MEQLGEPGRIERRVQPRCLAERRGPQFLGLGCLAAKGLTAGRQKRRDQRLQSLNTGIADAGLPVLERALAHPGAGRQFALG
jgi:hypothetical protein